MASSIRAALAGGRASAIERSLCAVRIWVSRAILKSLLRFCANSTLIDRMDVDQEAGSTALSVVSSAGKSRGFEKKRVSSGSISSDSARADTRISTICGE